MVSFSSLGALIKSVDFFGQSVGFEVAGSGTLNSFLGALLSLSIVVITLFYATDRFETMIDYGDTTYQSVKEDGVNGDTIFEQQETNFNIAFELAKLNNFSDNITRDYSNYLELTASVFKVEGRKPVREILGTHRCSLEEFKTKFYTPAARNHYIEEWFDQQLLCLDKPELLNL